MDEKQENPYLSDQDSKPDLLEKFALLDKHGYREYITTVRRKRILQDMSKEELVVAFNEVVNRITAKSRRKQAQLISKGKLLKEMMQAIEEQDRFVALDKRLKEMMQEQEQLHVDDWRLQEIAQVIKEREKLFTESKYLKESLSILRERDERKKKTKNDNDC
jgi:hypothetical protein